MPRPRPLGPLARHIIACALVVALSASWAFARSAHAQRLTARRDAPAVRTFVHARCRADGQAGGGQAPAAVCAPTARLRLRHGDPFTIVIDSTDRTKYDYAITGLKAPDPAPNVAAQAALGTPRNTDVVALPAVYDRQFAGYVVRVTRKPDVADADLGDLTATVTVEVQEWRAGFGGGFTASNLTDPAYAIREEVVPVAPAANAGAEPTTRTRLRFVDDPGRRDDASPGAGSFVHVWHGRTPWLAATFGLGLERDRAATYFAGPSLRLGDQAVLTAGPAWGRVRTPPPGVAVGDSVGSANVINTLGMRTRRGWFVGLSYTFIGGAQDALKKPFADPGAAAGAAPAGGAGSKAAAAAQSTLGGGTAPHPSARLVADTSVREVPVGQEVRLRLTIAEGGSPVAVPVSWEQAPGTPSGIEIRPVATAADGGGVAEAVVMVRQAGQYLITATARGAGPATPVAAAGALTATFRVRGCVPNAFPCRTAP